MWARSLIYFTTWRRLVVAFVWLEEVQATRGRKSCLGASKWPVPCSSQTGSEQMECFEDTEVVTKTKPSPSPVRSITKQAVCFAVLCIRWMNRRVRHRGVVFGWGSKTKTRLWISDWWEEKGISWEHFDLLRRQIACSGLRGGWGAEFLSGTDTWENVRNCARAAGFLRFQVADASSKYQYMKTNQTPLRGKKWWHQGFSSDQQQEDTVNSARDGSHSGGTSITTGHFLHKRPTFLQPQPLLARVYCSTPPTGGAHQPLHL